MKKALYVVIAAACTVQAFAQETGEALFKQSCAACHKIEARLVGPALKNVGERRSEEWLIRYIKSSQTIIKGGDEYANKLFNEYNQVIMPDQPLSDDQIRSVLAWIAAQSPPAETAKEEKPAADEAAEEIAEETDKAAAAGGDVTRGQHLFNGIARFANNGPTCNSCHNVQNDALFTGGVLARDLTEAHTRLTEAGIKGILSAPPFPQMTQAYKNNPLTEQEVDDLAAFLRFSDKQRIYQHSRNAGGYLLWGGGAGIVCLLLFYALFWGARKTRTVNHSIYERQKWGS